MRQLREVKTNLTRWHMYSMGLMVFFLFFPVNHIVIGLWYFTHVFIHEMGHAYFDLLAGDFIVTIFNNPPSAQVMKSAKIEEFIFIALGGVIFTSFFYLFLISCVFLLFKYRGWTIRHSLNFGRDTMGFHLIILVFLVFLFEFITNMTPIQ